MDRMKSLMLMRRRDDFIPAGRRGAFTFLGNIPVPKDPRLFSPGPRLISVNGVNDLLIRKIR